MFALLQEYSQEELRIFCQEFNLSKQYENNLDTILYWINAQNLTKSFVQTEIQNLISGFRKTIEQWNELPQIIQKLQYFPPLKIDLENPDSFKLISWCPEKIINVPYLKEISVQVMEILICSKVCRGVLCYKQQKGWSYWQNKESRIEFSSLGSGNFYSSFHEFHFYFVCDQVYDILIQRLIPDLCRFILKYLFPKSIKVIQNGLF